MNKEQIRENYLKFIEPKIQSAEQYADDPRFDKLMAVCNSSYGYSLFHPVCKEFSSKCIDFDALCELFSYILYCLDDDGDLSFVSVILGDKKSTLNGFSDKELFFEDTFIMNGNRHELKAADIFKIATTHGFENTRLCSYVATRFDWDTLDFLYGLLAEWEAIAKLGTTNNANGAKDYFKECRRMDCKFRDYISKTKGCVTLYLPVE